MELAVVCVELDVEVELELVDVEPMVDVELLVVGVELRVVDEAVVGVDEVEDVVVDVGLEELEVLRTKYAPTPATATMMMTIAAIVVRAIPPLFCSTKKCAWKTLFKCVGGIFSRMPRAVVALERGCWGKTCGCPPDACTPFTRGSSDDAMESNYRRGEEAGSREGAFTSRRAGSPNSRGRPWNENRS